MIGVEEVIKIAIYIKIKGIIKITKHIVENKISNNLLNFNFSYLNIKSILKAILSSCKHQNKFNYKLFLLTRLIIKISSLLINLFLSKFFFEYNLPFKPILILSFLLSLLILIINLPSLLKLAELHT